MIIKIMWGLRAACYKLIFGKIKMLSYIGRPCYIGNGKNIFIGKNVRIYPGVRMETYGKNGKIVIEDHVSIGQNFHITSADSRLQIGSGTLITGNVFVTNIDHEYQDVSCSIIDQPFHTAGTQIGKDCFIGFGAGIQAGTILGDHCIVGAGAVVRGTFPNACVLVGSPAKIVKRYNDITGKWEKTER